MRMGTRRQKKSEFLRIFAQEIQLSDRRIRGPWFGNGDSRLILTFKKIDQVLV